MTIHFEKGVPTAVDGKEMGAVELVEYLNKLGGANGIGLLDIVENRLVGMKSRGVYETPGGAILYKAINVLETITLDKESAHLKEQLAQKYADIVYNGQWFTPLREALDAFANSLAKTVTGDVKLKLYKGNMINAGVTSPFTLYDEAVPLPLVRTRITNQADAAGFINLFGLSIKERAKLSKSLAEDRGLRRRDPPGSTQSQTFSPVCFLHFRQRSSKTGIVAGGTAAGAFYPCGGFCRF